MSHASPRAAREPNGEIAPTLTIQPEATRAWVSHYRIGGSVITAIFRQWRPGEAARCRLCPLGRCVAQRDGCLVQVDGVVSPESARTFSAVGRRWQDDGSGLGIFDQD